MVASRDTVSLRAGYACDPAGYDEMCLPDGSVRPHWRYLADSLDALGPPQLAERQREAVRLLRDDGATYNVYGDPGGESRPWGLDPVPLQIASEEWSAIEAGLQQRAELLALILADLYGPRHLIRKGLVPPELVYGHQGFLRECHGAPLPAPSLLLYAVDLVRRPDGGMSVINDRTQAPSGVGYALENRTVMSRVLPSLFRESHPHRLAYFFRSLREGLAAAAPPGRDDPNVVILTPGVRNETYFEHVYLANYLGYTLVEGSDLAVRDGRLWLRSLSGLERVDVVLRRVDDGYCDPVELRPDSRLGVPGLLEAVRRRGVTLANPIGAGVLENPGLFAFLPAIARHYFGHDLALPSVPTWWCGRPGERRHVLARLDHMVIRSIDRRSGAPPVFGSELTAAARGALRRLIEARPELYVGQERADGATTPVLVEGRLQPRRAILRAYLVAREGSYLVMPGGLTRVAVDAEALFVSNQAGAVSKDTWVLASEPERKESLWPEVAARARAEQVGEALGSRSAESLFWLGRYAERAEQSARLLRVVLDRRNEVIQEAEGPAAACLERLLRALTHLTATYPGFLEPPPPDGATDAALHALVTDEGRTGTLAMNLRALLEAASAVRALLSSDTWRAINRIEDRLGRLRRLAPGTGSVPAMLLLDQVVAGLMELAGLTHESMGRELGWRLLESGRRLERGLLTASLLRSLLVPGAPAGVEPLLLESLLGATETLAPYRRRHRSSPEPVAVLELLALDEGHPRSLAFQLARLRAQIERLPGQDGVRLTDEARAAVEAHTLMVLAEPGALAQPAGEGGRREDLDQRLGRLALLLAGLSDALTRRYFAPVQAPQQLVDGPPEAP